MWRLEDFDYDLPEELIAQKPLEQRDMSRLLVYDRKTKSINHRIFKDIVEYLQAGDTLVINDTKVIPARLIGYREDTGGKIEFLLLRRLEADKWEIIERPGHRAKIGTVFVFGNGELKARILEKTSQGGRIVEFMYDGIFEEILDKLGQMPLPPYIKEKLDDKERYQTVYAKNEGSAAAPTAGLHFTDELLQRIEDKGVNIVHITLHVGLGTFRPVKEDDITKHQMHSEYYQVSRQAADVINDTHKGGHRVFAVGTTCVRTLETVTDEKGITHAGDGWTDIFIYPGYRFKAIDALITNFHLPKSTLLMLISAFAGREEILRVYKEAVEKRYRFFSFGDAMLIL
ncbi:tRNA preQ1(34) S-adenosylmethionine ribosyltransferase-isomerase QueA [Mahella sp.]|uniref:tRNA preQ1(34) S-adenosylmethionine ribosyltransferase-isomerase QueA n=1 Tax=Mahella sp. TaxID=2798721 RepID=UPI0025C5AE7A|nr:tRNA preQ1(34) S-adenosylmethionine ribosyltransferase-isomerase QueA [Mahella sp.]MBZ4665337.1 S-adenosylmethionine--tRNA ribosyltransferase-isomerase [Mahella sp.]MDK2903575.1 S-adenosylmethionine:tRNA ribosyltransferase-isomerase [Clostridiales bacterium]